MCPLWPAHYLIMYMMSFGVLWLASFQAIGVAAQAADKYDVVFEPTELKDLLMEGSPSTVNVTFMPGNSTGDTQRLDPSDAEIVEVVYMSSDDNIASVFPSRQKINNTEISNNNANSNASTGVLDEGRNISSVVTVSGNFIGRVEVCAEGVNSKNETVAAGCMDVGVIRVSRPIDKAFTYSVVALVAIIYINMGAALDTDIIKKTLRRPIGPVIGFMSQFVIMPLLSFGIAKALIPDESLQLGLFITGCSPGGGASNIWTLTLGGNLDLSITMTTISTFAAFVMMPLWILYFGKLITTEGHLRIPNSKIATFAVSLIVPLAVGIIIKRKFPKVAAFLVRMLKPFSVFLIGFIIVFAIYTNVYLFKLFTWQILVAGMLLPWLGYILGAASAFICKQDWQDSLAIGIETGVQNTGLAIFVLRFSLGQPDSDLTTVMPVAVAVMTPVLPLILWFGMKMTDRFRSKKADEETTPLLKGNTPEQVEPDFFVGEEAKKETV